jgi:hypothetical protein
VCSDIVAIKIYVLNNNHGLGELLNYQAGLDISINKTCNDQCQLMSHPIRNLPPVPADSSFGDECGTGVSGSLFFFLLSY